ncbi:MAG: DUF4380 domain-containing protein [Acidobacteriales bacterium]|nr:DUF4380 domain-containing protein [Terriglobales bacterium]
MLSNRRVVAVWLLLLLAWSSAAAQKAQKAGVQSTTYHGWPDSLVMSNGAVEAVVVPAIGRVMQFRFAGEERGPFFENRDLDGKPPEPAATEWVNFGGDKTWPAPQDDWPKLTPRKWPPPPTFDSVPLKAEVKDNRVELVSPVDPHYGIRTRRSISLDRGKPVMSIRTIYEKVQGNPVKVGVWVITQLGEPEKAAMVLPHKSQYLEGYNKQMEVLPKDLKREGRLLSVTRDPKNQAKIGSDAGTLVWMDKDFYLQIDSPRVPIGAEYPDQNSSAEIYTNPDPLKYIELETLGPLHTMKVGDKIERTNRYTLLRRSAGDQRLKELMKDWHFGEGRVPKR